jgi:hypothetical protein
LFILERNLHRLAEFVKLDFRKQHCIIDPLIA